MQVTGTQLFITNNEIKLINNQLDKNIQYCRLWKDRIDRIQKIALVVFLIGAFTTPVCGLFYFSICLGLGMACTSAKVLFVATAISTFVAHLLLKGYGVSVVTKYCRNRLIELHALKDDIERQYISYDHRNELQQMVQELRKNAPAVQAPQKESTILNAIYDAKLPVLTEEQQFDLLTEQAVHEIVPGLFLGGSDYVAKTIHRYSPSDKNPVVYNQLISATHWQEKDGFKPDPSSSIYKFPGDPNRNPVDVTLESFKSHDQSHLKEALQIIDRQLAQGKNVFVHCQQGKDRSATIVIAYIMSKYNVPFETALNFVRSKRWIAEPGEQYINFLKNEFQPVKL